MSDRLASRLRTALSTAGKFGRGAGIAAAQELILPQVLDVFAQHDHEELERFILVDYDLVEQELSEEKKNVLDNLGSNPDIRETWGHVVTQRLTPDNVIEWLHNAEDWLPDEADEEQVREMKYCAIVIEDTAGGREWLERQILELYRIAHIVPEDSTPQPAND